MPRYNWKGHISFGLVNIPIMLHSSENPQEKISFHQIDRRNNARIKYQRINAETGKEVPWEDVTKGYEYSKDNIIVAEEGELKQIAGENARTIAIKSFINADAINFIDIQKTYFLLPDKNGDKGYVILREALKQTKKIGIAKVIISTKEYLSAVAVYKDALVLYLLHYPHELYSVENFAIPEKDIKKYKVTDKEITIAKQLIKSMTQKWNPKKYKDDYNEAVRKWAEEKIKKLPKTVMKQKTPAYDKKAKVNFIDLLKKSLQENKTVKSTKTKKKKVIPAQKKRATQRKHLH